MSADETAFFEARGFGLKIGFGRKPALLVIDIVKAFTDPQRMLGADMDGQIEATNALIDMAHAKAIPVIYSSVAYDDANFIDAGVWRLKQKGIADLVAGSDGPELDPRLHFAKGDDLTSRLLAAGVDTLIMTGCTTSGCVRATAVDSCQTGFRPMVVREGVGDRSQIAHEQSLFDLNAKYADVVSLDETLAYLSALDRQNAA
jgi:nicotinamidase-related amidase